LIETLVEKRALKKSDPLLLSRVRSLQLLSLFRLNPYR